MKLAVLFLLKKLRLIVRAAKIIKSVARKYLRNADLYM
jgi:hypothetical protein